MSVFKTLCHIVHVHWQTINLWNPMSLVTIRYMQKIPFYSGNGIYFS